jgi:Na+-translocating ferredoxin:NAD+ oxidoreductase RnfG subunit
MKLFEDFILNENLAQAKSILMKKGLTADDETYKKIIQKTNKDGYTGLITRLILGDGEDMQEVLDLYVQNHYTQCWREI